MPYSLQKVSVRKSLKARREPYWGPPIARGKYVGFRKIDDTEGTWIARLRDDDGRQRYRSLGYVSEVFDFDAAKVKAGEWFKTIEAGISDEAMTVEQACREYVEDRRTEKGEATAYDTEIRFKRNVYNTTFGKRPLAKLRTIHIKAWRENLKLAPATSNRTLIVLKAALNLAVLNRQVSPDTAIEWKSVKPMKGSGNRRTLFLDLEQRRALLAACTGAIRNLVEAAMLTGARPGELVHATRAQFDARTASMTWRGKTGARTVALSSAAAAFFKRMAESKLPAALLLMRDDGKPWERMAWNDQIRAAAQLAGLPRETTLYVLRHSYISQAIADGMNTLEVARMTGTSLQMLEKHYGHVADKALRKRLAEVKML